MTKKKITGIVAALLAFVLVVTTFGFSAAPDKESRMAFASTTTTKATAFKATSSKLKRPTMLKKGQAYTVSGTLSANKAIKKFGIYVFDRNQFKYNIRLEYKVSTKKIDLQSYAKKIKFENLPSGDKTFEYRVYDASGNVLKFKQFFTVLGVAKEPRHMTADCKVTVTKGNAANLKDNNIDTTWAGGIMTITLPKNRVPDGFLIKWSRLKNRYKISIYNKNGKIIKQYDNNFYAKLHCYYSLPKEATKIVMDLRAQKDNKGICTLRVYEKGYVGPSVEKWESPKQNGCDLMVISSHRDDELLFFGGTIPYYQNVKKKRVYTMYMSGTDNLRVREALAGQWSMGIHTYPIFMGYAGGYHDGVSGTLKDWGGEQKVLEKMVEKIRYYRPSVIVTHASNGEYGHPTHQTVAMLVPKAVKLAKDKTKFPSSYKKYGAWSVQKVYSHCSTTNPITMNWTTRYSSIQNKSPLEMATIAFDKHTSQHKNWSMDAPKVKKYPNNKFGLIYTTVGKDSKKNDFFEHVKAKTK